MLHTHTRRVLVSRLESVTVSFEEKSRLFWGMKSSVSLSPGFMSNFKRGNFVYRLGLEAEDRTSNGHNSQ